MINAVIYARYSSDKQTEQSIEGQLRVCKEFAERNGYNIINEYIDRALTGRTDKRPAFLQMIEDSKEKCFTYIICYKLDRFSRNHYDSVFYKYQLKQYGVKVISATEAISDTAEGFLMEGLLEMMAEMYSRDLSQKVKRGINENLLKGKFIGGVPPFGYKVVDNKLEIDEEKAKIVRYIFDEFANGIGKKELVAELNAKGIRTNSNKPFAVNTLSLLKNKHYTGKYILNGIEYENYFPQIIDEKTFERVQERLKSRQYGGRGKAKDEYLLTGKVFCGHCGAPMFGASAYGGSKTKYNYYACSKRYKHHACNKKHEKKHFLEDYVIEQTLATIYDKKTIDFIATQLEQLCLKDLNALKLKEYEKRLAKLERDLDKLVTLMTQANCIEVVKRLDTQAKDLTIQKEDLEKEIFKLRFTTKAKLNKEQITSLLLEFLKGDKHDLKFKKRIINNFVNSVFVFDDMIVMYYNIDELEAPMSYEDMLQNLDENGIKPSIQRDNVCIDKKAVHHSIIYTKKCKFVFTENTFGIIKTRQ